MERSMGRAPYLVTLVTCLCLCTLAVLASPGGHSDGITIKWKQIDVNILGGGPTVSIMVEPDATVMDLRRDIYELEGVPDDWRPTEEGDIQPDLRTELYKYIRAGKAVTIGMVDTQMPYKFIVRTLDGRELPVTTHGGNTVASLKDNITQWTGIPQAEQRILLLGKELKNERKLVHYYIRAGNELILGQPLESCRQVISIDVRTLSGATVKVDVDLAGTVNGLKEKIWEKTGVPAGVQRLRANERVIAGEDHLCDLGLEAGSTVYMFLYSTRITSLDQVARLQEPLVARPFNNYKAPIFREVEEAGEPERNGGPSASLYKDARNWVERNGPLPGWNPNLFDPVAYLAPSPDDVKGIERFHQIVEHDSRSDVSEDIRLEAAMISARIKLSSAVRPYRLAANLTSDKNSRQRPGITLGGGSTDVSLKRPVSLGADVNNWAPDAFTDSDLMRLFEVAERVRQVLAKATQSGEGTLSITSQQRINNAILFAYQVALAGFTPLVEYANAGEDEVCGICLDDVVAEPAVKLACQHAFHADCILPWTAKLYQEKHAPSCPSCRQRFMRPYEAIGKAELATPELQGHLNE